MTVKELIELLQRHCQESRVTLVTEGRSFPLLAVSPFDGDLDLGGGWEPLDEKEEDEE